MLRGAAEAEALPASSDQGMRSAGLDSGQNSREVSCY